MTSRSFLCAACVLLPACVEQGEVLSRNRTAPSVDAAPPGTDDSTTGATSTSSSNDSSDDVTQSDPTEPTSDSTLEAEAGTPSSSTETSDVNVPDAAPTSTEQPELDAQPPLVDEPATDVSNGEYHACAVFTSGVACWGSNVSGQLGLGDAADRSTPTLLSNTAGWTKVHAAAQHSCALDAEGGVWCWGANDRGQLATGDRQSRTTPVRVALPLPVTVLASRFNHACAISSDASLYCWGENFEGQLGQADDFPGDQNPSGADALSPLQVPGSGWLAVDTGQGHSCAIAVDGSLWCWGRNTKSELGAGTEIQIRAPQRVDDAQDWSTLSAGQASNLALKTDGSLWGWGSNVGYDDGAGAPLGVPLQMVTTPTRVGEQAAWLGPSVRNFHGCALRADELWCWGRGIEGQLGLGDLDRRTEPTLVGAGYALVSVGLFGTCVLTTTGVVECAGKNDVGELGTGDTERRSELTAVLGLAR